MAVGSRSIITFLLTQAVVCIWVEQLDDEGGGADSVLRAQFNQQQMAGAGKLTQQQLRSRQLNTRRHSSHHSSVV
jgi:hypothetical protein